LNDNHTIVRASRDREEAAAEQIAHRQRLGSTYLIAQLRSLSDVQYSVNNGGRNAVFVTSLSQVPYAEQHRTFALCVAPDGRSFEMHLEEHTYGKLWPDEIFQMLNGPTQWFVRSADGYGVLQSFRYPFSTEFQSNRGKPMHIHTPVRRLVLRETTVPLKAPRF
jgi:hypothetical protein